MGKGFRNRYAHIRWWTYRYCSSGSWYAEGALDATIAYVKERKQFGRAIAAQQNTQFQLANNGYTGRSC